jgi:hypothetical protein
MADYTNSKSGLGATYPVGVVDACWGDSGPLITPMLLRVRQLFGIPLVSNMVDPVTGKRQVMTDPIIADVIHRAVALAELETHLNIMPRQIAEKQAFDRQAFASFGFVRLDNRPVVSLDDMTVTASNDENVFRVPPTWIDRGYMHKGQINLVPITVAFNGAGFINPSDQSGGANGGSMFLSILGQNPWIPSYWKFTYTVGFPEGQIPVVVNELIGVIAAIEILDILATTNAKNASASLSIDGLSQSVGTAGPTIYDARIQKLTEKKMLLVKKLKTMFGQTLFSSHI